MHLDNPEEQIKETRTSLKKVTTEDQILSES